jgi:hypothetical protein
MRTIANNMTFEQISYSEINSLSLGVMHKKAAAAVALYGHRIRHGYPFAGKKPP